MQTATIFFLPLKTRPKHFPPLNNFKGNFWHTGIIIPEENKMYECFNNNKRKVSEINNEEIKDAILLENIPINTEKVLSEIKSGTDCAEYVARCTGLSYLTGDDKGDLYPEDIYKLLQKQHNS